MKIGTTLDVKVSMEVELGYVNDIIFTLSNGSRKIQKSYPSSVTFDGAIFDIPLNQDQTLYLGPGEITVEAQINFTNRAVIKSTVAVFSLSDSLATKIISGNMPDGTNDADVDLDLDGIVVYGGEGGGAVASVNGKTGTVVLTAADVGALSDDTPIPQKTSDLINDSGFATETYVGNAVSGKADVSDVPTALSDLSSDSTHRLVTDTEKTAWNNKQNALVSGTNIKTINGESVLGSGNIVISGGGGAVDSVNGKTGVVVLNASDVGALPSSTQIPSKTSDLQNDSGFITSSAISGKEDASNKVTSISSASTDTQYPSAKCVYDLVGDIETLLGALL